MLVPWALVLVLAAVVAVLLYALAKWFVSPVVEARRLAKEDEQQQEWVYEGPRGSSEPFASLAAASPALALSVIIPAYNEEERIAPMLESTIAFLEKRRADKAAFSYEVIVVDDCSTDGTVDVVMRIVRKAGLDTIKLLRLAVNHGKGGAIRKGVLRSSGQIVLFADADGATHIRELAKLEGALAEEQGKGRDGIIICGSRAHLEEEAIAKRSPLRNFLMHGFHLIVSTLCVRDVRDTQCGFKLFDRTAARLVFVPMHIERWAFDVELLFIASTLGLRIREVCVEWQEIPGSKLSVIEASLTMFREIVLIRVCYLTGLWKTTDGGFRLRQVQQQ